MYIFLFAYYGSGGSGHAFKQIIANSEEIIRKKYGLDVFWKVETRVNTNWILDDDSCELLWEFEYFDPCYEG